VAPPSDSSPAAYKLALVVTASNYGAGLGVRWNRRIRVLELGVDAGFSWLTEIEEELAYSSVLTSLTLRKTKIWGGFAGTARAGVSGTVTKIEERLQYEDEMGTGYWERYLDLGLKLGLESRVALGSKIGLLAGVDFNFAETESLMVSVGLTH
jgi:hypothetical protein